MRPVVEKGKGLPVVADLQSFALEPNAAKVFTDVHPELERIVGAMGNNRAAALLGVDKGLVSHWRSGKEPISAAMSLKIGAVAFSLQRALMVFTPNQLSRWLVGSEPLLGGLRPLDLLRSGDVSRLVAALEGIDQGAFA